MDIGVAVGYQYKGAQLSARARSGAVLGLNQAGYRLLAHSVERAPVDEGDLRGSAALHEATETAGDPAAELVFDEPYAAKQHEDESLHHTPGANGEPAGEAKFVTKNVEDASRRAEYLALIGRNIRDALFGGGVG